MLQHGESEDPTLIHKPHDEANKALKAEVLQNISRKFDVSFLSCVPYVGKSALQRRRRHQTHHATCGSAEKPDDLRNGASTGRQLQVLRQRNPWTSRRKDSLLDQRISEQLKIQISVFSDSVLCHGGKCPDHLQGARKIQSAFFFFFFGSSEYRPFQRPPSRRCWKNEAFNRLNSMGSIMFMSMYDGILSVGKASSKRVRCDEAKRVAQFAENCSVEFKYWAQVSRDAHT